MPFFRYSAPTPLGPSSLWLASASRSTSRASTSIGSQAAPAIASTANRQAFGPFSRTTFAIAAIGWSVPTSLLASWIATRIVRSLSAAATWSGIDPTVAIDRQLDDLEPELLELLQRVEHGVVLDRAGDDSVAAALARPRGALQREVQGLRAAAREDDLARSGADLARDPLVGLVEGQPRSPAVAVRRARVAELAAEDTGASPRAPRAAAASWPRDRGRSARPDCRAGSLSRSAAPGPADGP